jgi:ElaB/YqjD/DUF883 family membrane-anchored ribosome-binding protein
MTTFDQMNPLHPDFRRSGVTSPARTDGSEEIVVEIEGTQVELDATLDAIHDRLSPENLKKQARDVIHDAAEEAKGVVREAGGQAKEFMRDATVGTAEEAISGMTRTVRGVGTTMLDTIRQNPIPAALVGIGLGWLLFSNQGRSREPMRMQGAAGSEDWGQTAWRPSKAGSDFEPGRRYGLDNGFDPSSSGNGQVIDRAQDAASRAGNYVQNAAGEMTDRVQSTAGRMTGQAQQTAERLTDNAQQMTSSFQGQIEQTFRDTPLVLGAVALAAGVAVGLALPETDQENQLMGEARDGLMQQVKDTAQDTQQKLQQVAQEAGRAAQEEARQQQLTP